MKDNQLNWGILGTANIARRALIPAIKAAKNNQLVAVASRSLTKAQEFARLNGIPKAYGSYEELLNDPDIQAVYIPLPNDQHKPWSIKAMQAGKHVLCEKPIGLNAQEASEMAAAAEEYGVVLMEAFMYRYHPRYEKLIKIVREGTLGDLRSIRVDFTYNQSKPNDIRLVPEMGGGALMDVGCYCIDIARQFAGREPLAVQAQIVRGNTGIDLQVAATMDMGDSIYAQFEAAFNTFQRRHFHIAGTQGRLDIYEPYYTHGKFVKAVLETSGSRKTFWSWPKNEYRYMIDHFYDVVVNGAEQRFPLSHSMADMRVIDALFESAQTESKLVKMNAELASERLSLLAAGSSQDGSVKLGQTGNA